MVPALLQICGAGVIRPVSGSIKNWRRLRRDHTLRPEPRGFDQRIRARRAPAKQTLAHLCPCRFLRFVIGRMQMELLARTLESANGSPTA